MPHVCVASRGLEFQRAAREIQSEDPFMNMPVLNPAAFGGRKVIDADTHLTEPHDLWTKRAPARLKDRAPQVRVHNGVRSWLIDGDKILLEKALPSSTVRRDGSKWL